ncbi:unnamed protein product [Trifolium pratense]|uniref:Uncharacterized protein n=1 Tax=Trifolium pratense TaxID=57577 RepID=A0ACB0K4U3_TRIPR|nr:unnamed protein product [Trifolium pratense]
MSFAKYPHCYARVFVKIFWKPSMIINACDLQFFLLRKWMEIIGQAHQNVEARLTFLTLLAVHTWSVDSNQFIADGEDATYSCRISGLLLLEELVNSFDCEGFLAIIDASKQWFNESQVIKVECNASWWRILLNTPFYMLVSLLQLPNSPVISNEVLELSLDAALKAITMNVF